MNITAEKTMDPPHPGVVVSNPTTSPEGIRLRPGRPQDAEVCGTICYEAFSAIAGEHNFPPDFPSVDATRGIMGMILSLDEVFSVIAEKDGRIVGSNFLWETGEIAGVGPITVDPVVQNGAIGRRLMEAVLTRAGAKGFSGVRLVQAGYHRRSLALYAKLGFVVREPLVNLQGSPLGITIPGCAVRPATDGDLEACGRLCSSIHGHERTVDLAMAIKQGTATVVERENRITGYATAIGFFGHAVGETNQDIMALIGAAKEFSGPGFLLPMRNGELFRWCLSNGLRVVQPMTLMSLGLYSEPDGAFLPSVLF